MTIGSRLKQFAKENFKTLQTFAEALGMKLPGLYDYFNDSSQPGTPMLLKLNNLGCDINWLLTGETRSLIANPEENKLPKVSEFRVLGSVPAGHGDVFIHDWIQTEVINYDPRDHDLLMIDEEFGYSMTPVMKPGDLVIISYSARIVNDDKVAARWDDTKGAIKIVNFMEGDPSQIVLRSSNLAEPPIFKKRREVKMYKVVGWFDRQSIKNR